MHQTTDGNFDDCYSIYKDYSPSQINDYMVSKQADLVMLLFLMDDLFDEEIRRKNFVFYEAHTLHDSSLSKSTHSILANDLHLDDMAYSLYRGALGIDLGENMKTSDAGIHSASMGGIWQSAVMGFGGIRIKGDRMQIAPKLPKQWKRLSFNICWKGARLRVDITKNGAALENTSDRDAVLYAGEEKVLVPAHAVASISLS